MFAKLSKYRFEIIVGIILFVVILYFLPGTKVSIPDIGELKLDTVDLAFVVDDEEILEPIEEATDTDIDIDVEVEEQEDSQIEDTILIDIDESFHLPPDGGKDSTPAVDESIVVSYASCTTPRNTTIAHGDSVLAYAQRRDDPAICNIQRRICDDGNLRGSFTQPSCKEYLAIQPQTQQIISHQQEEIDPFIQPESSSAPNTSSSQFVWPDWWAWWGWGGVGNSGIRPFVNDYSFATSNVPAQWVTPFAWSTTSSSSSSTVWDGTVCMTPWWEEVRNGQFVRAYKSNKWFSNLPCEVELRYCVQTVLEWSFAHPSCQHFGISWEDYFQWYYDPNDPTFIPMIQQLHGSADEIPAHYGQRPSLWQRVKLFFQRLF